MKAFARRIKRDWAVVDFAAFGKRVTVQNGFPKFFVKEWARRKKELLTEFYDLAKMVGDLKSCCIEDIIEDARTIARKARKLAISRQLSKVPLKEAHEKIRLSARKLAKNIFSGKRTLTEAMKCATQTMIVHDALAHLVGASNEQVKALTKLVVAYYKKIA